MWNYLSTPVQITKSDSLKVTDTVGLADQCGLYCVGAGNLVITCPDNEAVTQTIAVADKTFVPFIITKLLAGTTVTTVYVLRKHSH